MTSHHQDEETIKKWEVIHYPEELPEDLKAFFLLTDGLDLRWDLILNGTNSELGG